MAVLHRNQAWGAENRLLSITEGSQVSSFTYDGLGGRVAIAESGGGTTGYLWCGTTLRSSYASGATQDRFLPWGEVDSGTGYYYERDHLGTVISTTNTSGITEATLGTDGYGVTLSSSGTAPNFGYAGLFIHQASGLYLTKFRAYDPYSGRWLSRDPAEEAGGGINLYAYTGDEPVNSVDRTGEDPIIGATVGAIAGAYYGAIGAAIAPDHTFRSIVVGGLFGGVVGAGVGALDPTLGIGTLAVVGGVAGAAGDIGGQLASGASFSTINYGSTVGAALGGALGGAGGTALGGYAAASGISELVGTALGTSISSGPGTLLPDIGAALYNDVKNPTSGTSATGACN